MYRIISPDLAHVRLDRFDFTVGRDHALLGVWLIQPAWDDDPELDLGRFLAIRQAHHHGYTVWTTTNTYRQISTCDHPIDACDEILRLGVDLPDRGGADADQAATCSKENPPMLDTANHLRQLHRSQRT